MRVDNFQSRQPGSIRKVSGVSASSRDLAACDWRTSSQYQSGRRVAGLFRFCSRGDCWNNVDVIANILFYLYFVVVAVIACLFVFHLLMCCSVVKCSVVDSAGVLVENDFIKLLFCEKMLRQFQTTQF